MLNFSFVLRFEITPPLSISEPVAESVNIVKRGNASSIFALFSKSRKSQGSKSTFAPAQINFEASIVDPPPTARTTSIFSSLHILAPSLTDSILGLGSIPESSKTSSPASLISFITSS